ncbi:MAG: phenylacetate--CoA ligase family protein [Desulfomonilaceae bacterium]
MGSDNRNAGILNRYETLPYSELKTYQENFLREVIRHAYTSGTPLKKNMDAEGLRPEDIASVSDLQKLPITHKKDLSEAQKLNPPFGGFLAAPLQKLARIHQSPGPIYDPVGTEPDYWRWKTALYSVGFRPGDLVVNTFAYHLTPAGHMFEEGIIGLGGVVVPTGVGNTETQVEIIKTLGVTGFIGTPSFLMAILKKSAEMGFKTRTDIKLEVAFLAAEMLPESMRNRFLDEYGIVARQAYGTADVGCVSYECPETNGMHIHYDVIVEIVDPDSGRTVPEGTPGEVVVTCNNKTYPLVRFGTGDLSSISYADCPCGRKTPMLTRIMGRVDQVTKVKGMFVHPSQVEKVVEAHPEIAKARLVVERPADQDLMILEIELKGAVAEGFVAKVEQTIRDFIKLKGSVSVLEPGSLGEEGKVIEDRRKWD